MSIEFRWLNRTIQPVFAVQCADYMQDVAELIADKSKWVEVIPERKERVLQYRQLSKLEGHAWDSSVTIWTTEQKDKRWTDWTDVPEVSEGEE